MPQQDMACFLQDAGNSCHCFIHDALLLHEHLLYQDHPLTGTACSFKGSWWSKQMQSSAAKGAQSLWAHLWM
jgi:hypothetical protein